MKTTFFYGMTVVSILGLTACSNDVIDPSHGQETSDGDKSYYVSVSIRGDVADTRGGGDDGVPGNDEFQDGQELKESTVKNAYFVFYNETGTMIGNVVNVTLKAVNNPSQSGTVESQYYQVVKVDTYKGQGKPKQVMCYINPTTPAELQNPLTTIETVTRERVRIYDGTDDDGSSRSLFPMSNSVHFHNSDTGNLPDSEASPIIATQIADHQIFESEALAQAAANAAISAGATPADKEKVLNIYVERYASKLTFNIAEGAVAPYSTTTRNADDRADVAVTLTFNQQKWALNGEAKTTYVVKSMRQAAVTGMILNDRYTFGKLDNRINASTLPYNANGFIDNPSQLPTGDRWFWNSAENHRCFWAISPAYFTAQYPEVEADITDNLNQTYLSYNDIINHGNRDTDGATPHYYRETTVGAPALASDNPAAAMASVVLVGNYSLKIGENNLPENTSFYTYVTNSDGKPYVFLANQTDADNNGTMSMLDRFLAQQTVLYSRTNIGTEAAPKYVYSRLDPSKETDKLVLTTALQIAPPDKEVKIENGENFKLAERQHSLQFKKDAITSNIFVANGNGYKEIVTTLSANPEEAKSQITMNEANAALMNQVGYAVLYTSGHAFFNIPVKHLGWYRPGNKQKFLNDDNGNATDELNKKSIDWSLVRVGDFGMVRNHTYNLKVIRISGLAAGVAGDNTPIIPPADTKDYYMVYRVNILKWAIVPPQEIEL